MAPPQRMVDLETALGSLRVGLWVDNWVIAYRREGEAETELFDVFAKDASDLVRPLIQAGLAEPQATALAERLITLREEMDSAGIE